MLTGLLQTLVDRCIQLAQHKKTQRRSVFTDIVQPIQDAFESVHNDYLATFRQYRSVIATSDSPLDGGHPVFEMLQTDSLFSQSLRNKLERLAGLVEPGWAVRKLSPIEAFIVSIVDYSWTMPSYDKSFEKWAAHVVGEIDRFSRSLPHRDAKRILDLALDRGNIPRCEAFSVLFVISKLDLRDDKKKEEAILTID